jgi:tol-pal system protein YbgF
MNSSSPKNKSMRRLALPIALVALLTLPLAAVKKDTKLILDELQKLNEAVSALDSRMTAEMTALTRKVDILDEKLTAVSRGQADLNQSRENLSLGLQYFKEELNELKNTLSQMQDRLIGLTAAPTAAAQPTGAPAAGGAPAAPPVLSQEPSSAYYAAYSDYIKENFDLAIEGFRQFLKTYPDSSLADNALYWIGECDYAKKKYIDAIAVFNDVISRYRDGDKVSAAMLKKAYALIEMGKQSEGTTILRDLVSRFPLSEEASLAQQKIKEIME